MHDIKWIRDNPDAFDRGAGAARPAGDAKRLIGDRRAPPRGDPGVGSGAGAPQRGVERDRRGQEEQRGGARPGADGRGRQLKEDIPRLEGEAKAAGDELDQALAGIPNLPLAEVPDGADENGNVEHHHFGASARTTRSRRSSISNWARRSARWISRPRRNSPARALWCSRTGSRSWSARSGSSCSTCTPREHGYTEVSPPLLVRDEVMFGTAQLPKFADDQFLATRTITRTEMLLDGTQIR